MMNVKIKKCNFFGKLKGKVIQYQSMKVNIFQWPKSKSHKNEWYLEGLWRSVGPELKKYHNLLK